MSQMSVKSFISKWQGSFLIKYSCTFLEYLGRYKGPKIPFWSQSNLRIRTISVDYNYYLAQRQTQSADLVIYVFSFLLSAENNWYVTV